MGMSASQARLLSITARLTNNEFRAQTITDRKLRLADDSSYASQEYMEALNSQKLVFGDYSSGSIQYNPLTAGLLFTYAPLKNQYALRDASGKALVTALDAKNFEETNSLSEFLDRYGLVDTYVDYEEYNRQMEVYEKNLAEYARSKNNYDQDMLEYQKKLQQYNTESAQYAADKAKYDADYEKYMEEYLEWVKNKQDTGLYDLFSGAVGTWDTATGTGASFCYYHALRGDTGCYLHLLNYILDYSGSGSPQQHTYTTSANKEVTTNGSTGGMSGYADDIMGQVSEAMNEPTRFCDGDDDLNVEGKQNLLEQAVNNGREPSELEILRSDYIRNADGSYSLKTLKQKAIDMYYIIQNLSSEVQAEDMKNMLINFTDGDMRKLSDEPKKPEFNGKMPTPPTMPEKPKEPDKPQPPKPSFAVKDKEKCQWYTNLWNMMNGSDSANVVQDVIEFENNNSGSSSQNEDSETLYRLHDLVKNASKANYKVLEDNLIYNDEWLEFALEHGIVTMSQAQYYNPADDSEKALEMTAQGFIWNSIIYTNASDIVSQDDDVAIARAEAKYKKTMNEIEAQDNKYDRDLKKLDTEHNALQTEYDSIKEVINKNVERSFKAFS